MLARVERPTLAGFLEFAKRHPQGERYQWWDMDNCACAQYARHIGQFDAWRENDDHDVVHARPANDMWEILNTIATGVPYTFGNLVKEIEKEMAL
jgi:hypothetical protein